METKTEPRIEINTNHRCVAKSNDAHSNNTDRRRRQQTQSSHALFNTNETATKPNNDSKYIATNRVEITN